MIIWIIVVREFSFKNTPLPLLLACIDHNFSIDNQSHASKMRDEISYEFVSKLQGNTDKVC